MFGSTKMFLFNNIADLSEEKTKVIWCNKRLQGDINSAVEFWVWVCQFLLVKVSFLLKTFAFDVTEIIWAKKILSNCSKQLVTPVNLTRIFF